MVVRYYPVERNERPYLRPVSDSRRTEIPILRAISATFECNKFMSAIALLLPKKREEKDTSHGSHFSFCQLSLQDRSSTPNELAANQR